MADEVDEGDKIRRIREHLANPTRALKQIGAIMVAESQDSFKQQAWGGKAWQPRKVPNVFGILADFYQGKTEPAARRFEDRPALRDTGRLAASIAWAIKTPKSVEVGSNLPYARLHHLGLKSESEPITDDVRKRLYAWLQRKGAKWKARLGWLLNRKFRGQKLETTLPKRPIVGITKQTQEDIYEIIGLQIFEVKRGGKQ